MQVAESFLKTSKRVVFMSGILLVRDIMARNVKTVRVDDTALEAVTKMNKFHIGSVIVTNNGRPIGIITERNILQRIVEPRLDPAVVAVKDIMSSPLVSVDANAAVEEAAQIMARRRIKKLPVVEKDKLIGVVSTSDIVRSNPTQLGILEELLRVR
jgi:CBS domain-containing protein